MRYAVLLLLVSLAACEAPPVEWSDPVAIRRAADATRLTVDSAGHARWIAEDVRTGATPAAVGRCATSLKTVSGARHVFAVWWSVRPDSSASLLFAASPDSGKTWGIAAAVDTSDVSSRGCNRPPPSLATVGDDLHVVYSMVAPEGTGVFFAHFMSSMIHSPVAVIYGERLVATAIAVDGEHVAVAYEDPNGKRQQVNVAYSSTQGHIFDWRTTATRDIDVATVPSVALNGRTLAVSWASQKFETAGTSPVVRVGRIR